MQTTEPEGAQPAPPDADVQTSVEDGKPPVPYDRFKEVNDQKHAAEMEKARLEAQLELLREQATSNAPVAAPPPPEPMEDWFDERAKQETNRLKSELAELRKEMQGATQAQREALQIQSIRAASKAYEFTGSPKKIEEKLATAYYAAKGAGRANSFDAHAAAKGIYEDEQELVGSARTGYTQTKKEDAVATASLGGGVPPIPVPDPDGDIPKWGTAERKERDARVKKKWLSGLFGG